jgi:hypothetical protein
MLISLDRNTNFYLSVIRTETKVSVSVELLVGKRVRVEGGRRKLSVPREPIRSRSDAGEPGPRSISFSPNVF